MQNRPLVYILILNWNSYSETIECVRACKRLDYSSFRILVVDNGSRNASVEELARRFPETELIQTGANLGYAAGNNIGIRHALSKGSDCIWVLNPDVLVEEDSLTAMTGVLVDNPSIGICGPRVIHGKEPSGFSFDGLSIESAKGYQWQFNVVDRRSKATRPFLVDVDCVSGCSMLIRSDLLRTIGLFREDFFLYYEDVELSFRARDHGWRTVVCTGTAVRHDQNAQVERQSTGFRVERSRIMFARLRGNCTLRSLITDQSMDLFMAFLKQSRLLKAFKLLLEVSLGVLCGLVKARKPLPVVDSPTQGG